MHNTRGRVMSEQDYMQCCNMDESNTGYVKESDYGKLHAEKEKAIALWAGVKKDDDWIVHDGGRCPPLGTQIRVDLKFHDGDV
jgi:hypothetical protein